MTGRRTADEVGELGTDPLKRVIEPTLPPTDHGRFIAVDVESGEHEVDDDDFTAVDRLRARLPTADVWLSQVGEDAGERMGLR